MILSDSSIRTEKDSHKMLCRFNMAARRSGCCSQSTAWLQACIEYGRCRQQASQPAQVRTQGRTCHVPAQLLPYSCVLTSRSERFPHQVLIIFAPTQPSCEDVWRLHHSQAMSTTPAGKSSAFTLLFYPHGNIREIPTKCCSSLLAMPEQVQLQQLPSFMLAFSMTAADNKRLNLRKFGRKDEHAICQLRFYPTLVSSPHVQRDSHIKF